MFGLLELLMDRETSRLAWLNSAKFFDNLEALFTVHLPTTDEWNKHLEVIYHDFLISKDPSHPIQTNLKPSDRLVYEANYQEIENHFNKRQSLLIQLTGMLADETPIYDPVERVATETPMRKFTMFVEKLFTKSTRLIDDINGGIYAQNDMNAAAISHTFTLTNVFVCLEQTLSKALLSYEDLSDFPIQAFFMRELPEFDQSLRDAECLGGTLSFLE